MSSVININNFVTPDSDRIDVVITCNDAQSETYDFIGTQLGDFEYGSDDPKETVFFPSQIKIAFTVQGKDVITLSEFDSLYYKMIELLSIPNAYVSVYKNSSLIFKGIVDQQYKSSTWSRGEIEINVLHIMSRLKEFDPKTDPVGYYSDGNPISEPGPNGEYLFIYMICDLLRLIDPSIGIQNVQVFSPLRCKVNVIDPFTGTYYIADADNFGTLLSNYFWNDSLYENCLEVIKEIMNVWGAEGAFVENNFVIRSRGYYSSATTKTLLDTDYRKLGAPSIYEAKKIMGLEIEFRYGSGLISQVFKDYGEVYKDVDGNITNIDRVETFRMTNNWGGHLPNQPSGTIRNLVCYVPDYILGIGNGGYFESRPDEFFTVDDPALKALWDVLGTMLWNVVSQLRTVYNVELNGKFNYEWYYAFENYPSSQKFRPKLLTYNELSKITTLMLLNG